MREIVRRIGISRTSVRNYLIPRRELSEESQRQDIPIKWRVLLSSQFRTLMCTFIPRSDLTVGELLARLRGMYQPNKKALADNLGISYTSYLKIERGQRELSFLMALRVCKFYQLDIHDFISMLSDEELSRADLSVMKARENAERKTLKNLKQK